jgi:L-amino acid N-acyltransferase YncA
MGSYAIRRAAEADVARVLEISNQAALATNANFATDPERLDDWRRSFAQTQDRYPWLVACAGPEIVGFAKAGPHRTRGAYRWSTEVGVYLEPAHCGKGLGGTLYARLLELLEAQGYRLALAGISQGNEASEKLHRRLGFVPCGVFHRVGFKSGRWLDVGYWEKHFGDPAAAPGKLRRVSDVD